MTPVGGTDQKVALRLHRLSHRLLLVSHRGLLSLHSGTRAVASGVWLGLLDRSALLAIGDAFYSSHDRYADDRYNRSGLWEWERAMVAAYFGGRHSILLVGAGAGREAIALARRGHRVRGFECNGALVATAARLLIEEGLDATVELAPPDTCPPTGDRFDGLVVGWGAYMLVAGRRRRIALLRSMRAQAEVGVPLLLSFFVRPSRSDRFALVATIANALRRLRGREPVELGDDLEPEYVHYFDRAELEGELAEGGFALLRFEDTPYGHAVAVAV